MCVEKAKKVGAMRRERVDVDVVLFCKFNCLQVDAAAVPIRQHHHVVFRSRIHARQQHPFSRIPEGIMGVERLGNADGVTMLSQVTYDIFCAQPIAGTKLDPCGGATRQHRDRFTFFLFTRTGIFPFGCHHRAPFAVADNGTGFVNNHQLFGGG